MFATCPYVCALCARLVPGEPEESVQSPGTEVNRQFVSLQVGATNQTQVLQKSSLFS